MRGPTSGKRALRFVLLFGVAAVGLYAIRPHGPLECSFADLVGVEPGAAAWSLGTFPTEAAGVRASIQTIARELAHCPGQKVYRVWWSEATDTGTLKAATLYLREYNMIGLERDPYSGIRGTAYITDDAEIAAVAAKQGTLSDFSRPDSQGQTPTAQHADAGDEPSPVSLNTSVITDSETLLPLYRQLLKQLLSTAGDQRPTSLVLQAESANYGCHPHCTDSTRLERMHTDSVAHALLREGLITAFCLRAEQTVPGCNTGGGKWVVTLGVPFRLRPGFRIPPAQEHGLEWIGELPADTVIVNAAVDIWLWQGFTEVGGHTSPDLKRYRYFLTGSGNRYTIMVRVLTGQT